MLRERAQLFSSAILAVDVIAVAAANMVATFVAFRAHGAPVPLASEVVARTGLWLAIPLFLVCFRLGGLYGSMRMRSLWHEFLLVLRASVLAAMGTIVLFFVLNQNSVSRLAFTLSVGLTIPFVFTLRAICRLYLRWLRARGRNYRNYLVIGSSPHALTIARNLQDNPDWGIRVIGLISETTPTAIDCEEIPVLGSLEEFRRVAQQHVIDVAIFAPGDPQNHAVLQALEYCRAAGIETAVEIPAASELHRRIHVQQIAGSPLLQFSQALDNEYQLVLKRAFDVLCASVGLIVAAPLMAAVALLIKISSPGPILFKQVRVGTRGRRFTLYKFRTMVVNAEALRSEIAALNEMDGPVFKMRKDPRVTPIGRYLRKASLDELPQLWNVLVGDMSIVGPRPPLPSEVDMYDVWHLRRLSVKPGLTCLWQVSGRNSVDFQTWMNLDLQYIDSWSWWLDLKIIARTVPAMLKGQ